MFKKSDRKDMLKDAHSSQRKKNFRIAGKEGIKLSSMDEYISFLEETQKVFGNFPVSKHITKSAKNKL